MYSRSKMYRKGMRIFIWALLALTGWLHAEALAQSGVQPEKLLTLWAGSLPIILSAPHGGRQAIPGVPLRQGIGVAQFKAEPATPLEPTAAIAVPASMPFSWSSEPSCERGRISRKPPRTWRMPLPSLLMNICLPTGQSSSRDWKRNLDLVRCGAD